MENSRVNHFRSCYAQIKPWGRPWFRDKAGWRSNHENSCRTLPVQLSRLRGFFSSAIITGSLRAIVRFLFSLKRWKGVSTRKEWPNAREKVSRDRECWTNWIVDELSIERKKGKKFEKPERAIKYSSEWKWRAGKLVVENSIFQRWLNSHSKILRAEKARENSLTVLSRRARLIYAVRNRFVPFSISNPRRPADDGSRTGAHDAPFVYTQFISHGTDIFFFPSLY